MKNETDKLEVYSHLKIRKWARTCFIFCPIAFIAIGLGLIIFKEHVVAPELSVLALLPLFILGMLSGFVATAAPCPRCSERFAVKKDIGYKNPLTAKCLNCGLKLDGSNIHEDQKQ